jgi:hypothetical protein
MSPPCLVLFRAIKDVKPDDRVEQYTKRSRNATRGMGRVWNGRRAAFGAHDADALDGHILLVVHGPLDNPLSI